MFVNIAVILYYKLSKLPLVKKPKLSLNKLIFYQNSRSFDVSSVVDVKTSESISASDGVGNPAVVGFGSSLAVEVLGGNRGHVRVDRHVLGDSSS